MLQRACRSWTCNTLTTQTVRQLLSTHYIHAIYTMHIVDLHCPSCNLLKLITGLINWKILWMSWDSRCTILITEQLQYYNLTYLKKSCPVHLSLIEEKFKKAKVCIFKLYSSSYPTSKSSTGQTLFLTTRIQIQIILSVLSNILSN